METSTGSVSFCAGLRDAVERNIYASGKFGHDGQETARDTEIFH